MYEKAIEKLNEALNMKPEEPGFLISMSNCFRFMGEQHDDQTSKFKLIARAREISNYLRQTNMSSLNEATSWIYQDNSKLPTPMEKEVRA
jgi:hypothetical protein